MESASARASAARPFYASHAWAYDLLVTDVVEPWVDAVDEQLSNRGTAPARILDAGCGTGRHAAALVARGHQVTLADASAELLAIARHRCPTSPAWRVDLTSLSTHERFTAVTCRGVLNDLLTDAERQAAVTALVACLRPAGLLICDVREANASADRADGRPRTTTVDLDESLGHAGGEPGRRPPHGTLAFTSTTRWRDGLLHVHERHEVRSPGSSTWSEYDFRMRPWTARELTERLQAAGLDRVAVRPGVGRRSADRLLVIAEP